MNHRTASIYSGKRVVVGLGRVKTHYWIGAAAFYRTGQVGLICSDWLCSHCRHQRPNAQDIDDPGQIVGQHVQCHLGSDLR
jgi:hypothetical protein